jgi:hypothetical protein
LVGARLAEDGDPRRARRARGGKLAATVAWKFGDAAAAIARAAVGERLMSRGHSLFIWNRNPEKAKALVAKGAAAAATQPRGLERRPVRL